MHVDPPGLRAVNTYGNCIGYDERAVPLLHNLNLNLVKQVQIHCEMPSCMCGAMSIAGNAFRGHVWRVGEKATTAKAIASLGGPEQT
jgi:hypothetical protein